MYTSSPRSTGSRPGTKADPIAESNRMVNTTPGRLLLQRRPAARGPVDGIDRPSARTRRDGAVKDTFTSSQETAHPARSLRTRSSAGLSTQWTTHPMTRVCPASSGNCARSRDRELPRGAQAPRRFQHPASKAATYRSKSMPVMKPSASKSADASPASKAATYRS